MSAVSCILLRRSSCRRRKDVLSDFFVASAMEQVPQVLPSAFSTICEPGSWYGAEEYWVFRPMPCCSAAASAMILNVEPVCSGALA